MKRFSLVLMILCTAAWIAGCNKDKDKDDNPDDNAIVVVLDGNLNDGSIIIDGEVLQDIDNNLDDMLEAESTISTSSLKMGVKADNGTTELKANDYRFKLVAEMGTLKMTDGYEVQATDVKITDGRYAFVSYNDKGDAHRGGVVVYKYTIHEGSFEDVKVDVEKVTSVQTPNAEFSAIEFYNNKLYMIGASSEPKFGYIEGKDRYDYAFLLVMELNAADKKFNKNATPKIVKLTSFQGTSIRVTAERIYITTGDGANGTQGGLYILKTSDYSLVNFIEKDHARSVDVDGSNVYVMQAESARVTKYDLTGNGETTIYPPNLNDLNSNEPDLPFEYSYQDEAMQQEARSDMIVWNEYLFVSMNESGLRMVKNDSEVMQAIERPGEDKNKHVTNSVCMNIDEKKDANGIYVQSNLLLLANGEKGVYWYDVMKDASNHDRIVAGEANSILAKDGLSTNFISSRENIVFVANGLGGLKVLYIGFSEAETEETCSGAFGGYETFLKANGNSKLDPPLDKKVGDVLIRVEGDYLVIYLWPTVPNYSLKNSGVEIGPSLEEFDTRKNGNQNLFNGSGAPKDKNVNNGYMSDWNKQYRTLYSDGSARFAFPKEVVQENLNDNGDLLIIVYSGNNAWGYGVPNGPSGQTGTGVNNNGQIIYLKSVTFCD